MSSHARGRRRGGRWSRGVAVAVAVAVAATGGTVLDGTASAEGTRTSGCPDVTLVLVDGSGQRGPEPGQQMATVKAAFEAELTAAWTYDWKRLPYAAESVEVMSQGPNLAEGAGRYLDSIGDGINLLQAQVEDGIRSCPGSRFALAGYSQGAIVTHLAVDRWSRTGSDVLDHIDGVAYLADGARITDPGRLQLGSAPDSAGSIWAIAKAFGVWPFPDPGRTPAPLATRTVDICDKGDLVCDTQSGALNGIDIHVQHYTRQATRAGVMLARWAMGHPTPAPATQTVGGVRGLPFKAGLTFKNTKLRATLSLVEGELPPGLNYDPVLTAGRASFTGRPTADGVWNTRFRISGTPGRYGPVDVPVTFTVTPPGISPSSLPQGVVGMPYSQQLAADLRGTPTWSASGELPEGVTLSPTGLLSGIPTAVGSSLFSLTAASGGRRLTAIYALVVDEAQLSHPQNGPWLTTWPAAYPGTLPPLKDAAVERITTSGSSISVLYADGTAQRWSWISGLWQGGDIEATGITRLSAGGAYITDGQAVHNWRMYCCEALAPEHLAPGESRYVDVVGNTSQALALTDKGRVIAGQVPFAGLATAPDWVPSELNGVRVVAIEANHGVNFAVTDVGEIVHWQIPQSWPELDPPADICPASRVRYNGLVAAICKADGSVRLWGNGGVPDSRLAVPAGLTDVRDVAIGNDYVMALRTNGTVIVWGDGAGAVPPVRTGVFAIASGFVAAIGR